MSEEASKPAPKKRRPAFLRFIPLLAVMGLLPAGAWFGIDYIENKKTKPQEEETSEESVRLGRVRKLGLPSRFPVPVIDGILESLPKSKLPQAEVHRLVRTNSTSLGQERIAVPLADKKKPHHVITELFVSADNTDELVALINANQPRFYNSIAEYLSQRTLKEVQGASFRKTMRDEVRALCDKVLGTNVVKEVIIAEIISK